MFYVQMLACVMCRFVHVLCELQSKRARRSARLARFARVHVESTCEISLILSLVPDSPNHPTCLPDRARRLPDMSPIRHQAGLANSVNMKTKMLIKCYYSYRRKFLRSTAFDVDQGACSAALTCSYSDVSFE